MRVIHQWDRMSTDWKRWAIWWALLAVVAFLGWRVSSSFWIALFLMLLIVPSD